MSIISISRGSLAGATAVAEEVASTLQIPCISREVIVDAAREGGISEKMLTDQINEPPNSFFNNYSKERDIYLWYIRSALCRRAAEGSFVYHGHGGHLLLANISSLLRVGVVASLAYRIDAVVKSQGIDAKAAEKHIKHIDKWRKKWGRHLYGVDWLNPARFDLCINLEKINVEQASQLVVQTSKLPPFVQTDERQQEMLNAALVSKVSAELAKGGELFTSKLSISAENNILTISGKTRSKQTCTSIHRIAEKAIGEAELRFDVIAAMDDISWN